MMNVYHITFLAIKQTFLENGIKMFQNHMETTEIQRGHFPFLHF